MEGEGWEGKEGCSLKTAGMNVTGKIEGIQAGEEHVDHCLAFLQVLCAVDTQGHARDPDPRCVPRYLELRGEVYISYMDESQGGSSI